MTATEGARKIYANGRRRPRPFGLSHSQQMNTPGRGPKFFKNGPKGNRGRLNVAGREIKQGGWRKRGRCRFCHRAFDRAATGRLKRFCSDKHRRLFARREGLRHARDQRVARGVQLPIVPTGIPMTFAQFVEAEP